MAGGLLRTPPEEVGYEIGSLDRRETMLMHPGPLGVDHSRPGRSAQVNPIGYSGARAARNRVRHSWAALRRGVRSRVSRSAGARSWTVKQRLLPDRIQLLLRRSDVGSQ